jgi:hypothetical protein
VRTDWLPMSASALVIGFMALVFGSVVNPSPSGRSLVQTMSVVDQEGGRWMAMSVMYFVAAVALTLGLPAVLSLFARRGRRLGMAGVALFTVGIIGTAGLSMLMVFFRALVDHDVLVGKGLNQVANDNGLAVFVTGWVIGFDGGLLLLAIALLVARKTAVWVPVVIIVFVALQPMAARTGRLVSTLEVLALAVAFTGVAIAAMSDEHRRELAREPVF